MDSTGIIAGEMESILKSLRETADTLLSYSAEKETALLSDDIDQLKAILEREEDAIDDFKALERLRVGKTKELVASIGAEGQELSLRQIGERLGDKAAAARLINAGDELAQTVSTLQEKGELLKNILTVKSDYASIMLEMIMGGNTAKPRNYTSGGGLDAEPDTQPGVLEIFA